MREPNRVVAGGALALFVGAIIFASHSPTAPPKAMAMPKKAFETHSKDIVKETAEMALLLDLSAGKTL